MFIKVSKYTTYIQSNMASVMYTVRTFSVFNLMDKSHIVHFLNPVYSFCPSRFQSDTTLTTKRSQCKCNKISKNSVPTSSWPHIQKSSWLRITVALYMVRLEGLKDDWSLTMLAEEGISASGKAQQPLTRPKHLSLLAGTTYCHLPLHPPPFDAQMAGCSLVRFLWCMLWWRISSSDRANFFWQLDQRQVKGFSPDRQGVNKEKPETFSP